MEAIASEVPSASTGLLEQVLDEYGDPATRSDGPPKVGVEMESVWSEVMMS
jgi:hypothetical protein